MVVGEMAIAVHGKVDVVILHVDFAGDGVWLLRQVVYNEMVNFRNTDTSI